MHWSCIVADFPSVAEKQTKIPGLRNAKLSKNSTKMANKIRKSFFF